MVVKRLESDPATTTRVVSTVLAARPDDPFVRWRMDYEVFGAAIDGDHVAWVRGADYGAPATETWCTTLGSDPVRIAALIDRLDAEHHVQGVTVEEDVLDQLPDRLRPPEHGHWCYWTINPADVSSEPVRAIELAPDDPRIDAVLAHSPSAEVFAGDPRVRRWAGVVDGDTLLAVGAEQRRHNGAAHLLSICTAPEARGQGLAYDVCLLLMQGAGTEGVPIIFLEMYAANDAGRKVYTRLGFAEVGRYRSGRLLGR